MKKAMKEKLINFLYNFCDNNKIIYKNEDVNLFETGIINSMSFIELLVALEKEFEIDIEPSNIKKEEMSTPKQLVNFVERKLNV